MICTRNLFVKAITFTIFELLKTYKTISIDLFRLQNKTTLPKLFKNLLIQIVAVSATSHSWKTVKWKDSSLHFSLFHGDKYIVSFHENSVIFNSFFADQCSPISSGSVLSFESALQKDSTLSSCHSTKDDVLWIINNLDPNKAHGYDKISIRMLKICGDSICRPLNIIFEICLGTGKFPVEWKKANIVPIHKKVISKLLKLRPVSLLPICGKIFER